MVSIAASSISKPRSQPHTGAPTSLQAPPSWGPVPPQHARATAAVEQGVAGGRAEDVPTVRYDEKDGVMAIQDVYGVMYAIADRKKASNKMRYNWNEGRDKEMHACLVEKFYEKNQRYDFTKHTRTSASFAPMVVSSRSELLLVCDVTLRMAPQSNGGSEEQQQQLRARTLQLLKCFNTNYPRMWPNEEDPFPVRLRPVGERCSSPYMPSRRWLCGSLRPLAGHPPGRNTCARQSSTACRSDGASLASAAAAAAAARRRQAEAARSVARRTMTIRWRKLCSARSTAYVPRRE
jgi:hypothetical protein